MRESLREKHLDRRILPLTETGEKIKNSLSLLEIGAPVFLPF